MARLTKSKFLKGRQCARRLWLDVNRPPEPAVEPDEIWEMREAEGAEVERIAETRFQGLLRIMDATDEDEAREARDDLASLVERTRIALLGRHPIAQAYLQSGGLLSITDILEPRGEGWYLWEVKASTSLKPIHDWDLAFQVEVARRAGVQVAGAGIVRLDDGYIRGAEIDPNRLLVVEDRTAALRLHDALVRQEITLQQNALAQAAVPPTQPSARCKVDRDAHDGNRPSTCGHFGTAGYCGSGLPAHWAGQLPRLSAAKWADIRAMPDPSIEVLDPEERVRNQDRWTSEQKRCIRAVRTAGPIVDTAALRAHLDRLRWPVAYVDFEFDTGMAVPRFPGCRPYDKLPFQWSMLVQERPGGHLAERPPFLHLDATDPRQPFAEALLEGLPAEGSIVAHHQSAETGVINQLADRLGGPLAVQLTALVPRFFDTEALAKAGYCHADQKGSWSIKKLAPALLGKGYEGLAIQNGLAAVVAWKAAVGQADLAIRERQRSDLLAYCCRDTSLMHDIVERLRALSRQGA